MIRRRDFVTAVLAAPAILTAHGLPSQAQPAAYPSRPIRVIWPGAAGGGPYALLRLIAQEAEAQGAMIVVEEKPGAGGVVGTIAVKQAKPDGYTILLGHIATHAANVTMLKDLGYDPSADFEPVTSLFLLHQALLVPTSLGVTNVKELRELARAKKGGLSYASPGIGAAAHLMAAMLAKAFDAPMTHVPYRNSSAARPDLLTGRVDMMFNTLALFQDDIKTGTLRAIAVASPDRLPHAPDIPTLSEQGFPNIDIETWFGLFAPAKTSPDHLEILNKMFASAAAKVADRAAKQGFVVKTGTRAELAERVRSDTARLAAVIKEAGALPN